MMIVKYMDRDTVDRIWCSSTLPQNVYKGELRHTKGEKRKGKKKKGMHSKKLQSKVTRRYRCKKRFTAKDILVQENHGGALRVML